MSAPALEVRLVPYTDPLVVPLLADLDHEYSVRYGHSLGDLAQEARRRPRPRRVRPAADRGRTGLSAALAIALGLTVVAALASALDRRRAR